MYTALAWDHDFNNKPTKMPTKHERKKAKSTTNQNAEKIAATDHGKKSQSVCNGVDQRKRRSSGRGSGRTAAAGL